MDVAGCSGKWRDLINSGTFYEIALQIFQKYWRPKIVGFRGVKWSKVHTELRTHKY